MIPAAVLAFLATNLDDLLVLTLLYSRSDSRQTDLKIFLGQFLGIGILVLLSFLAAKGLLFLPDRYIRFLGVIPVLLGLRYAVQTFGQKSEAAAPVRIGLPSVVFLTISNGGDNIGVYTPLFCVSTISEILSVAAVFAVCVPVWCMFARFVGKMPKVRLLIERTHRVLVPLVLIGLGSWILLSK